MEPLPHCGVDQLVDETRGERFFRVTKLDLAMAYMQFRIREEGQFHTSLNGRLGSPVASTGFASALLACVECQCPRS